LYPSNQMYSNLIFAIIIVCVVLTLQKSNILPTYQKK
jgi:hypothetical protein